MLVQQGRSLQGLLFRTRQIQGLAEFRRVHLDPSQMVGSRVVLCFYRQRQHFDRPQVQRSDLFGVPGLIRRPVNVKPIGTKHEVHHRSGEQHRRPTNVAPGHAHPLREGRAA